MPQYGVFSRSRLHQHPIPKKCIHPQEWVETERACYLIRQHVYANLSHRLGTRPFLSHFEKVCGAMV
jgi:hypothetical protein